MDSSDCDSFGDHVTSLSSNSSNTSTSVTTPTSIPTQTFMGSLNKKRPPFVGPFTRLENSDHDGPQENCNYYSVVYSYHYKRYGTTQIKKHILNQCKKSPIRRIVSDKN